MMKVHLLKLLTLLLIIYSLGSCNDPIFYMVTVETPLIKPYIDGSPSNFAIFNNEMYVASGKKIYKYGNNGSKCVWSRFEKLGDYVVGLAATGNSLYAHYLKNNSSGIKRFNGSGDSYLNLNSQFIQTIYTSANILFICVRSSVNTYTIHYLDEDDSTGIIKKIDGITAMLNGVVSDSNYYYLCTYSGIYYVEKDKLDSPSDIYVFKEEGEEDKIITGFKGIINLNDNYIAAININGDLYEITNTSIAKKASFNDSRYSTGAIGLWYKNKDETTPNLLLVGRDEYYYSTTSGYSNGYVEIELDNTGRIKEDAKFRVPGKNQLSSIDNYDRYVSSLGTKIIKHFIQTPASIDSNMTLFASTQKDGVWSYRDRDDGEGITWNAEK